MGILQLPVELIWLIADFLSIDDLSNTRSSCLDLYYVLNRYLYRRLRNDYQIMQCAISRGKLGLLRKLLDTGSNPSLTFYAAFHFNFISNTGRSHLIPSMQTYTSLHMAIRYGHQDLVRLLLERGADMQAISRNFNQIVYPCHNFTNTQPEWMPLCTAIIYNRIDMVELLLSKGASFQVAKESSNNSGRYVTAFHISCYLGHMEISNLILHHFKPQIDAKDPYGNSPLDLAVFGGNWDMFVWLADNGAQD